MTQYASQLKSLAASAKPINDDDWGSERQIVAENSFYNLVATVIPNDLFNEISLSLLKATSEECIDEFLGQAISYISEKKD